MNIIHDHQPVLKKNKFNVFYTNYEKPTCILDVGDYDSFEHFFKRLALFSRYLLIKAIVFEHIPNRANNDLSAKALAK